MMEGEGVVSFHFSGFCIDLSSEVGKGGGFNLEGGSGGGEGGVLAGDDLGKGIFARWIVSRVPEEFFPMETGGWKGRRLI